MMPIQIIRNIIEPIRFFTIALILTFVQSVRGQAPDVVVQNNLDCYNNRDIDCFMSFFSEEIEVYNFGENKVRATGLNEVRKIYAELFKNSPKLHSTILKRIVIGNKVIDHEQITGRGGSPELLELVLIYEVSSGKINKITVIRH